jgi:hypothetical protein
VAAPDSPAPSIRAIAELLGCISVSSCVGKGEVCTMSRMSEE